MYQKIEICPICNGTKFENRLICTDHTVSQESFAIVACTQCDLWLTSPRPVDEELHKYYKSDAYISHSNKANSPINFLYKIVRNITLRQKTNLLKSLHPDGTVLDYGCGTGDFLHAVHSAGFKIAGVEPDKDARQIASQKNQIPIHANIKDIDKGQKAHIITLWHVLEHVSDLNDTLKKLRKRLAKDGHMIIAVPNRSSYDAQQYQEHWAAYDVPRHLYHFNSLNIKRLAKKHNLRVTAIKPQYFDAFYVSMLSEEYAQKTNTLLKGLVQGYKSNKHASKNKKNYSSLIYILTR